MRRFEDLLREWLDRRWRTRATKQEITDSEVRVVLDSEHEAVATLQNQVIARFMFLIRAERSDGWERAQLIANHRGPHVH